MRLGLFVVVMYGNCSFSLDSNLLIVLYFYYRKLKFSLLTRIFYRYSSLVAVKMQNNTPHENNRTAPIMGMSTREKEKYVENFSFPYCNEASKYEKVCKIGQGTFG